MASTMTTNDVRRKLEDLGAVNPGRRAVLVVARHERDLGKTSYWEMCLPDEAIQSAIRACSGLKGDDSYRAFTAACSTGLTNLLRGET